MLSFFPRGVLDEILNLIESVSEGFPSYSFILFWFILKRKLSAFLQQLINYSRLIKKKVIIDQINNFKIFNAKWLAPVLR